MNKFAVASIAALLSSTPALAADFDGAYGGIAATVDNPQFNGAAEGFGINGVGASAFVGYDLNMGGWFTGLEANIDMNTADVGPIETKWGWGISGRVGATINDKTALYGRVGYQRNKISVLGFKDWGDGLRLGGGIETSLNEKTALRVELNHVNYEDNLINNQGVVGVVFRF